jgi:hypothetical protein
MTRAAKGAVDPLLQKFWSVATECLKQEHNWISENFNCKAGYSHWGKGLLAFYEGNLVWLIIRSLMEHKFEGSIGWELKYPRDGRRSLDLALYRQDENERIEEGEAPAYAIEVKYCQSILEVAGVAWDLVKVLGFDAEQQCALVVAADERRGELLHMLNDPASLARADWGNDEDRELAMGRTAEVIEEEPLGGGLTLLLIGLT